MTFDIACHAAGIFRPIFNGSASFGAAVRRIYNSDEYFLMMVQDSRKADGWNECLPNLSELRVKPKSQHIHFQLHIPH
mgnify:CR=1 FL=1